MADAAATAVFAVLADAATYSHWVVGSRDTRGVEGTWPEPGSTLHHADGLPPLTIEDTTSVLHAEPPTRLVLETRTRPFLVSTVELFLHERRGRTRITMVQDPVGGWLSPIYNPLLDAALALRNAETLRRLKRLAERRAGP